MDEVPEGYWYCPVCTVHIAERYPRDLTFDSELIQFLILRKLLEATRN